MQRCLGIDFWSDFVGGFFFLFGKKKLCQRFFCRDLMVEVSLQHLVETFLHFLVEMFSLRLFSRNFSAKTFSLIFFFNNFVGRDVCLDFVGRFVVSKIVSERFLCADFSSEIFCADFSSGIVW